MDYFTNVVIEDVERGAELSFSGPLRGPPSQPLRQILFSNGRTDGQTQ